MKDGRHTIQLHIFNDMRWLGLTTAQTTKARAMRLPDDAMKGNIHIECGTRKDR